MIVAARFDCVRAVSSRIAIRKVLHFTGFAVAVLCLAFFSYHLMQHSLQNKIQSAQVSTLLYNVGSCSFLYASLPYKLFIHKHKIRSICSMCESARAQSVHKKETSSTMNRNVHDFFLIFNF